jgi:uncharacterized membrane protein YidH (DUF202 family)
MCIVSSDDQANVLRHACASSQQTTRQWARDLTDADVLWYVTLGSVACASIILLVRAFRRDVESQFQLRSGAARAFLRFFVVASYVLCVWATVLTNAVPYEEYLAALPVTDAAGNKCADGDRMRGLLAWTRGAFLAHAAFVGYIFILDKSTCVCVSIQEPTKNY